MNEFERNQQEPKMETLGLICTKETFRPYTLDLLAPSDKDNTIVRWLDQDEDFLMAKDFWTIPLSRQDWIEFHEAGYRYCAVIKDGRIISLAAAWHYSDKAWEVAAVCTKPEFRIRGYGKVVVSFVTTYILEAGRLATCTTKVDNMAMIKTAEGVGFQRQ